MSELKRALREGVERQYLLALGAISRRALSQPLVRVHEVSIHVERPDNGAYTVAVRMLLERLEGNGPVYFDAADARMPLLEPVVTAQAGPVRWQPLFRLDVSFDDDQRGYAEFKLLWLPRAGQTCVLAPELVPRPLRSTPDRGVVVVSSNAVEVEVYSIHRLDRGAVSAVIVHNPVDVGAGIATSAAVGKDLTAPERDWLRHVVTSVRTFMIKTLGPTAPDAHVLISDDDGVGARILPSGHCVLVDRNMLGLDRLDSEPRDLLLAEMLAGAWIGGGIAIKGANRLEIACGVRLGIALTWTSVIGEPSGLDPSMTVIDRLRRTNRFADALYRLRGRAGPRRSGETAVTVYEAICSRPSVLPTLREFIRANWGGSVDARELLAIFY